MPRVICDLPNAALEINGVPFEKMEDGRIRSAEVEQEIADFFLSIPGYLADGVPVIDKTTAPKPAKAAKPAKTAAAPAAAPAVDPAVAIAAAAAAAEAEVAAAVTSAAESDAPADPATDATAADETGEAGATGDAPPADDVF